MTSAANLSKSTTTRSGAVAGAGGTNVTASPTATVRGSVAPRAAASGPAGRTAARSARPARSAGRAHVGRAAAQVVVRAVRAVQARAVEPGGDERGRARPAASVAGPRVATIFVRRSSMGRSVASNHCGTPCVGADGGSMNNTGGRDEGHATGARDGGRWPGR